jgi:diketogulonate reductase-like aldo/keto reductase
MRTRVLGPTGEQVVVIGQGTWQMEHQRSSAIDALRAGLDAGLTHIDTAEMYGSGAVEELVGEALAGRREQAFLVSKVLPGNASYQGTLDACEASLQRLRSDHLDLYLLHWPGAHPLEETFAAFERLRERGKIRHFGVSNFDERALQRAVRVAGPGRIACNQVLYHLRERHVEQRVIPACEEHGVAVVGYSPFGSGSFPARSPALEQVAARYNASPHQLALAFLARRQSVFLIPKAAHPDHARQNAAADDLRLTDDDLATIDAAFPLAPRRHLPII